MYIKIYNGGQLLELLGQHNVTKFSVNSCDLILKSYSEDTEFDASFIAEIWMESKPDEIYDRYKYLRYFSLIPPSEIGDLSRILSVLKSYTIAYESANKYSEPVILYKLF